MAAVNPYLTFNGQCEAAFNFYKSAFGGEFLMLSRFSEIPPEMPVPEEDKNKVMHVALPIGKGSILMGSDTSSQMGGVEAGTNYSIAIAAESEAEARKLFDSLSAGGKVTMPLEQAFWGALFGMFTDKFGINWMINFDNQQQAG
jgi:PhnB protein